MIRILPHCAEVPALRTGAAGARPPLPRRRPGSTFSVTPDRENAFGDDQSPKDQRNGRGITPTMTLLLPGRWVRRARAPAAGCRCRVWHLRIRAVPQHARAVG